MKEFLSKGEPVISVDTKKKECLGGFKNAGTEYRPKKGLRKVLDHDFLIPKLGKVKPYGVDLLNDNTGFVNLGIDHDTSDFSVGSIRRWWWAVGHATFPDVKLLYTITP
ncbi:ISAzo13-like element transposase-related protein [Allobaculum sp. JKK-2023]|uniref:ISAzo13-like element transposase-related protein n=1 Tax=Allobaculum sp. JKK-2023 TaxID=3108943 RepID=UPI003A599023